MEKMTLLEMTQNILSAMNSDEVNSISDTTESLQVAEEIRTAFRELYTNHDLATFESAVTLSSLDDPTTPNVMALPDNVESIKWLKYRDFSLTGTQYNDLCYLDPETFVKYIVEQANPASSVSVAIIPSSSATYPINNKKAPQYYTIFTDDQNVVFDSFDSDFEAYVTGSGSLAWGNLYKTFTLEDNFTPPLPASEFPRLLAEAKSVCFVNIKEEANPKEERRAQRQKMAAMRRRSTVPGQKKGALTGVDYSRKR